MCPNAATSTGLVREQIADLIPASRLPPRNYNEAHEYTGRLWPFLSALASAPTKLSARSVPAGWAKCIGQRTRASTG